MKRCRRWMIVAGLLLAALLAGGSCADGESACAVECIRTCIDDVDVCAWNCDQQSASADCYRACVVAVDECALACEG